MVNSLKLDTDLMWQIFLFVCACAIVFASSDAALAAEPTDVIGNRMCAIVGLLGGNIAKSIATIAIFVVGGGLLLGKLNWVVAMTVSVGVIIIFSASGLVAWISGSADSSACGTST